MHKLSVRAAFLEHELSELRLILERRLGVLLDTPADVLADTAASYLESHQLDSAQSLLEVLRPSDERCQEFAENLLDEETGFFRHPNAFEALLKVALPELQSRRPADPLRSVRIWSAGCASGQEVYSIAMSVCETVNCHSGGWKVHIVGSDIRRGALEIAQRGLYPEAELQQIPPTRVHAYFNRVGQHYLAKPRVRNLVTFTSMNLVNAGYIGRFDCIFCMDVLPHFSGAQRTALLQRLHLYLEPGGYLFLGQGERLPSTDVSFNSQKCGAYTFYKKPLAAAAGYGR